MKTVVDKRQGAIDNQLRLLGFALCTEKGDRKNFYFRAVGCMGGERDG